MHIQHQDLIKRLKELETLDLLYLIVEAKAGAHLDILSELPTNTVQQAEEAVNGLISLSKAILNTKG